MLGKLIKYDLRSMIRRFVPLWTALAVLSVLNGYTIRNVLNSGNFKGTLFFLLGIMPLILLVVLWMAVAVMTLVYICERFYKGLLGDEGYLMLTLPVTTGEHIAAKTTVAFILEVATGIVGLISWGLLMVVYQPDWLKEALQYLPEFFTELFRQVPFWFWAELTVLAVVTTVANTLHIYVSICLGHLAKKHRVGMSFVAYVAINMAMTTLTFMLIPLLERMPDNWYYYVDSMGVQGYPWVAAAALGATIVWQLLQCAAFWFGSDYVLKNKLNLE